MHVVVVFVSIGRYHAARLHAAYKSCQSRRWQLTAVQITDDSLDHPWGDFVAESLAPVETLLPSSENSMDARQDTFSQVAGAKLKECLERLKPDAVLLPGYALPAARAGLEWCRRHKVATVIMSDSKEDDAPRVWWREKVKERIVRRFDAALVAGEIHKEYLVKLGMKPAAVFPGYDVVGNKDFHPSRIRHLAKPIERPYFLAINRFVSKKNLPFLLHAYADYRRRITNTEAWDLVLCGDGELRPQIEKILFNNEITDAVHLPGFLEQTDLLPYFAHAKCFIHASLQEQWGLVVNEAMAAGLPVLVSKSCGCFADLVVEGINGFGFDPTNETELVDLMLRVSSDEAKSAQMGEASLAHIQNFSPDYFAENLIRAVEYATQFENAA